MEVNKILPQAPPGWTVAEEKGRLVYQTSHPVVKIQSVAMLKEYQKKGRYQTVEAENLVFSRKKLKVNHLTVEKVAGARESSEPMEGIEKLGDQSDNHKVVEKSKLEKEQEKVLLAVQNLTIEPKQKIDHKESLRESARKLNNARLSKNHQSMDHSELAALKSELCTAQDENEIAGMLWKVPFFKMKFSTLINSRHLEQLLSLGSVSGSPLLKFPPDVNANLYSDIIDLALAHAPDFLFLILNLAIKHENPLVEKDVIKTAYLFSHFASSVNSKNNVLKKIKSITMKCNGLTNEGLDCLATVGAAETSRSFRNMRDFMASISDEVLKSFARTMIAQFTFDNLDLVINHQPHHLTLNFLEFEQTPTSELSTHDSKSFDEMKSLFDVETVLMQSDQNKHLFDHYKSVVAGTLGRLFGEEIPEAKWMLSVFPKHYTHPNSATACKKSLLHVDKPMYLQETKNRYLMLTLFKSRCVFIFFHFFIPSKFQSKFSGSGLKLALI